MAAMLMELGSGGNVSGWVEIESSIHGASMQAVVVVIARVEFR